MGQFSWISKNNDEQIRCEAHNGQEVWMVYKDQSGHVQVAHETEYEGYGEFGGVDYYEAVALMNGGYGRITGIDIAFGFAKFNSPQLFTRTPSQYAIDNIDFGTPNETDPNQGWVVYEDEE